MVRWVKHLRRNSATGNGNFLNVLYVCFQRVPYLGRIPGGLSHGQMIRIRGQISHVVTKFIQINVQTGPALGPSDDINLHLSIRLDQRTIVRNHMQSRYWGTEENVGGCPLVRGQFVEILILAQSHGFKVAINGKHFCEFNHRLPLSSARFIHVDGEMTIESITMDGDIPPSAPPMPISESIDES